MKQLCLLSLVGFLVFLSSCNKSVKDADLVKEFEILCEPHDLDSLYINYKDEVFISIKFISSGDTVSAKMRLRGDSSKAYDKKSLKIVFDKSNIPKGETSKINLNSEWTDKSYIRQYLSSQLMQKAGVPCFQSNYVKLSLNGSFWGLYLQVENMDNNFLKRNKLSTKGNLYKATKDGACLSHFDDIHVKWEKKTNKKEDWSDLQKLINELDTVSIVGYKNYLNQTFEYDRLITIMAMNMLLQHGSTYYHNYYLYHDNKGNGKWQMFPWDMDKTLSYYNWVPYKYHKTSSNWESDNPLIEKAFLNKEVMADIEAKIKKLGTTVFNNKKIDPIIDDCACQLEKAVKEDIIDQINTPGDWKKNLEIEKKYVSSQVDNILNQFSIFPTSFQLKRNITSEAKIITLNWQASKSKKKIKYKVLFGKHFLLEDEKTKTIDNITDTICVLKGLEPGIYYWRVYASDGDNEVEGFNTKSTFEVLPEVVKNINSDTTLLRSNSPHLVKNTWTIAKGVTLTIEPGCKLIFSTSGTIKNWGVVSAKGNQVDSIWFEPEYESWNVIENYGEESALNLSHCNITDGFIHSFSSNINLLNCTYLIRNKSLIINGNRASVIWASKGYFNIDTCYFENYNISTGEGINIHKAETYVKNSVFVKMADAIEFINVPKGEISGNIVINSPDDAIDMNGCSNITVKNNILINNKDKAISVGTEQFGPSVNITVENNFIINNNCGVSIKDSSSCIINNTSFVNNNLAIEAKIKNNWKQYSVGGNAKVLNCIFYDNKKTFENDRKSYISINSSISNNAKISGDGNEVNTISFIMANEFNYNTEIDKGAKISIELINKLKTIKK